MNKGLLEILSNKPELVTDFPEWMLPESAVTEIRENPAVAIAEIAGRDSIAAVVRACEERAVQAIVPTIAYTGTEYGNWEVPFKKTGVLKQKLTEKNIKVYDTIILGSPRFWWKICGRYTTHLSKRFGFYSQCLGCHLYFHAVRVPLAKKLHCNLIIGGERESHDGRIKINQIGISLDAYVDLLRRFDVELFLPIRHMIVGKEVEAIAGGQWGEGADQLECVLSGNYREEDESVILDEEAIKRFFDEFALKTAEEIIKSSLKKLQKQSGTPVLQFARIRHIP
jgi:hypothetical protein